MRVVSGLLHVVVRRILPCCRHHERMDVTRLDSLLKAEATFNRSAEVRARVRERSVASSAPGLGSPLPRLHRKKGYARQQRICHVRECDASVP